MYDKFNLNDLVNFTKTLRVLYVEDNTDAREALLALMSNFFYSISIAVDGYQGLEKFKESSFDLVITDMNMPKMDGVEMILYLRKMDKSISIIASTAHKDTELLLECIEQGVHGYLLRPINYQKFSKIIKQVCEKIFYHKQTLEYEKSLKNLVKERTKELEIAQEKLLDMIKSLNKDLRCKI